MLAAGEAVVSELDEKAVDILTFAEVKDGLAFLGLTEKMNGGAALEQMIPVDNGTVVNVSDGGTFLFYCARKIEKICVNGREAEYSISDGFVTVALKEKSTVFVQYS